MMGTAVNGGGQCEDFQVTLSLKTFDCEKRWQGLQYFANRNSEALHGG